jgi:hypothetical protein
MDEDVVWVARDAGALSEKALQCIAQASLKTDYDVYFRDARTQKRYDPLYWHLNMASEIASARQWLRERGLLATLPLPQAGKPLAAYAEAVEVFCGIEKRALLVAVDEHTITYTKGGLGHLTSRGVEGGAANDEQFSCVMNATSAVNLESHGFFFGFVGNAAAVRPTP